MGFWTILAFLTALGSLCLLSPLRQREERLSLRSRFFFGSLAVGFLPVFSLSLYLFLGTPFFAERSGSGGRAEYSLAESENNIISPFALLERRLRQTPEDGSAWLLFAQEAVKAGLFPQAVAAYETALQFLGPVGAINADFGEALVHMNHGRVTQEARSQFEIARLRDPELVKPRFFLILAQKQAGKTEEAQRDAALLLRSLPPDSLWRPRIKTLLSERQEPSENKNP